MSGHTPGPWHVCPPDEMTQFIRSEPTDAWSLGDVVADSGYSGDRQKDEANARLIAAAPCLLEVLQEILADGVHCDVVPHLHRKALAAIDKATKEQP